MGQFLSKIFETENATVSHSATQRIAGLDGLRGLAVTMVLGFHLYPRLIPGGWLGVSLFFTLSGFLITTVILRDLEKDTFSFKAFYARRVRRLVPAAVLVLTLFAVTWTAFGWFDENHRSDVFFALLQISNWQQIWEGVPYGTALASPVVHYWSLAIEEQAYLVLPFLIVLSGRTRLLKVALGLFALSAFATFLASGSQSVIYFGTHTRAAEVLAGVIVAAFLHNSQWRPQRNIATAVSLVGVGYLLWAAVFVHLNDSLVYTGGLLFTGLVSASVIVALPQSRLATFFDLRPFVWLGTVSYGVYLLHWPFLITLKQTDLPQWSVPLVTLALTALSAMVMYRKFELPMRFAFSPQKVLGILSVCVVLVSGGFILAKTPPASFEDLQDTIDNAPNPIPQSNAPKVFYFGDSKMMAYLSGLQNRIDALSSDARDAEMFSIGGSFARFGCPIGRGGSFLNGEVITKVGEGCDWSTQDTSQSQSSIAVIWSGTWDTAGRQLPDLFGDAWQDITDPQYRQWVLNEYKALFQHLRMEHGVKFIAIVDFLGSSLSNYQTEYNRLLKDLVTDPNIYVLNLNQFLTSVTLKDFLSDGSHVSTGQPTEYSPNNDNSAADLYEKWFEPALCAALLEKAPELLTTTTCPEIDYSPRVVKK
jgi:peptidoglycan/LPS O-acetylase OafA/YrhL